jgi:lipid II:glycine glycyltransferase (peptidoglycan interpeptide bridge formation enzyme)
MSNSIVSWDQSTKVQLDAVLTERDYKAVRAVETLKPRAVMNFYQIDPVADPRWPEFLGKHPNASVFHTSGWLEALRRTYNYEPIAYTSSAPDEEIRNGLVFCRINSWLTGSRLVSLPFSDHCEPLFDSPEELDHFVERLQTEVKTHRLKYLEVRPINGSFHGSGVLPGFRPARRYDLHVIDLRPELRQIRQSFHKDSVLRRIRRAEHAGLIEKTGRSEDLLKDFYELLVMTRARHDLPPQPYKWFRNLIDCMGDALEIRLAYKDKTPLAAILTLRFKDFALYKYGCSDTKYKNLGAMPLLLWRAIEYAKSTGAREFSLGRSDEDNAGLIAFKNHWTKNATSLTYWRDPGPATLKLNESWRNSMAKRVFAVMPKRALAVTGRLIYRHIG